MGRLAPGARPHIDPVSTLVKERSTYTAERHEAQRARMTLTAACASRREGSYPYIEPPSVVCGCGRCGR